MLSPNEKTASSNLLNTQAAANFNLSQSVVGPTPKMPSPLESFFLKSLQFYPNLLPQPLNFSQNALSKTTELLAKYQQQCSLYQGALGGLNVNKDFANEEMDKYGCANDLYGSKRFCKSVGSFGNECSETAVKEKRKAKTPDIQQRKTPVFESSPLAGTNELTASFSASNLMPAKGSLFCGSSSSTNAAATSPQKTAVDFISASDHAKIQQHIEQYTASCNQRAAATAAADNSQRSTPNSLKHESNLLNSNASEPISPLLLNNSAPAASAPVKPPSNSKLYATCFICHKQLSNQYNLRVHLETHQNVRLAMIRGKMKMFFNLKLFFLIDMPAMFALMSPDPRMPCASMSPIVIREHPHPAKQRHVAKEPPSC